MDLLSNSVNFLYFHNFSMEEDLKQYVQKLGGEDKVRYEGKRQLLLDGETVCLPDPYTLDDGWYVSPKCLPPLTYHDVVFYLTDTPGPFTGEQLRAYKSLKAYNYFVSGHVLQVQQHDVGGKLPVSLLKGFVQPSQRQGKPKVAWVYLDRKQGYIIAAHCTCLSGLGESCRRHSFCCGTCCARNCWRHSCMHKH